MGRPLTGRILLVSDAGSPEKTALEEVVGELLRFAQKIEDSFGIGGWRVKERSAQRGAALVLACGGERSLPPLRFESKSPASVASDTGERS